MPLRMGARRISTMKRSPGSVPPVSLLADLAFDTTVAARQTLSANKLATWSDTTLNLPLGVPASGKEPVVNADNLGGSFVDLSGGANFVVTPPNTLLSSTPLHVGMMLLPLDPATRTGNATLFTATGVTARITDTDLVVVMSLTGSARTVRFPAVIHENLQSGVEVRLDPATKDATLTVDGQAITGVADVAGSGNFPTSWGTTIRFGASSAAGANSCACKTKAVFVYHALTSKAAALQDAHVERVQAVHSYPTINPNGYWDDIVNGDDGLGLTVLPITTTGNGDTSTAWNGSFFGKNKYLIGLVGGYVRRGLADDGVTAKGSLLKYSISPCHHIYCQMLPAPTQTGLSRAMLEITGDVHHLAFVGMVFIPAVTVDGLNVSRTASNPGNNDAVAITGNIGSTGADRPNFASGGSPYALFFRFCTFLAGEDETISHQRNARGIVTDKCIVGPPVYDNFPVYTVTSQVGTFVKNEVITHSSGATMTFRYYDAANKMACTSLTGTQPGTGNGTGSSFTGTFTGNTSGATATGAGANAKYQDIEAEKGNIAFYGATLIHYTNTCFLAVGARAPLYGAANYNEDFTSEPATTGIAQNVYSIGTTRVYAGMSLGSISEVTKDETDVANNWWENSKTLPFNKYYWDSVAQIWWQLNKLSGDGSTYTTASSGTFAAERAGAATGRWDQMGPAGASAVLATMRGLAYTSNTNEVDYVMHRSPPSAAQFFRMSDTPGVYMSGHWSYRKPDTTILDGVAINTDPLLAPILVTAPAISDPSLPPPFATRAAVIRNSTRYGAPKRTTDQVAMMSTFLTAGGRDPAMLSDDVFNESRFNSAKSFYGGAADAAAAQTLFATNFFGGLLNVGGTQLAWGDKASPSTIRTLDQRIYAAFAPDYG